MNRIYCISYSIYAPEILMELDYITIVYVLDGNCILLTQDGKRSLKKGELVILAPGFPYRILCSEEDLIINILSTQKLFEDHFFEMIHQNELLCSFFQNVLFHSDKDYLLFHLPVTPEVCEIIKHLFMEYLSHDTCADAVFQNYLQIFYAAIVRNSMHSYERGLKSAASQKGHSMSALPLLQYIHENYQTVTLERLSEIFHYAPAYISRLIRKSTNKTFSELKTDMKTAEAKELLLHTNLSIEAISERVGYNSADHFTYSFRKKYEMSPREYRKLHNYDYY